MKQISLFIFLSHIFIYCFSQDIKQDENNELLKELAENGCKCVDSIDARNKSKEALSLEISKCINEQASAYQLGSKLGSIGELEKNAKRKGGKKKVEITINTNEDSKEHKKYYFELERYMLLNCQSLKQKMAASEDEDEKSMSTNPLAISYYNQAIEESEKKNYREAILLYRKATDVDSTFVNAWDNMGICFRRLDEYDKAIEAYKRSLEINPNGLMPLQNIAVAYRYKGDYLNAIKAYENLSEVDTNNPEVYFGLGQVYALNLNEYEKGLDNICKAYNLYISQKSPYRSDAEGMINLIYNEMKKLGKEDEFNRILELNNIAPN